MLVVLFPVWDNGSAAFLQRFAVASGDDSQVLRPQANAVEVDDFLVVFTARLVSQEDFTELCMELLFLEEAIAVHEGDGADLAVLHAFPIIDDHLAAFGQAGVFVFEVGQIQAGLAWVQPVCKHHWLGGDGDRDDDVTLQGGLLGIVRGDDFKA